MMRNLVKKIRRRIRRRTGSRIPDSHTEAITGNGPVPWYQPPAFEADWVPDLGLKIVAEAKRHLGKQYRWGTAGPTTFDCSGFTHYVVLTATGRNLPRSSYEYNRLPTNLAVWVSGTPQPGDILLFDSEGNGSVGHVGIMLDNGQMANALSEIYGVTESDPWSPYFSAIYLGAVRVV
jgi:cell wall-associated NlpC family hydrolase